MLMRGHIHTGVLWGLPPVSRQGRTQMMSDKPPKIKRRRPFVFWVILMIVTWGTLYPLSFGPACWLDSRRKPEANAVTASKWLNTFYHPIIKLIHGLDNSGGDAILRYAELFAAEGRQVQTVTLGPPGTRFGTAWLVWFPRGVTAGPWLCATPTPDYEDRQILNPPAANPDAPPESN